MKLARILLLAALSTLTITACTPQLKVTTDYDRKADFSKYKTFSLYVPEEKNETISQLNRSRIESAVKAEMVKKGLQEASSNPDVLVNVVTIIKNEQQVTANTNYYGYGGYYRPYGWGGGMASGYTTYNVTDYKDGSLIVEVVDANTKSLVWEGIGNQEIDKPMENPDQQIQGIVAKIMAGYPPGVATATKK
ncbi:DUF4136 domain-containing protein [Taibaiella soli]|uniref:DUF4136 domain-containing protein n=1 Tax=Taibaiella soli TaxID=1649169 RepID=A0A2W2B0V2_9BACT|nr:DUF4136 domain-containing protein [Taibaiella soli]PZF73628.1 DUF4136 domain-containing protein [Taibaiella soli]